MELALPITVYWDLPPDARRSEALLKLCADIVECRPLMLQLHDPSTELSGGAQAVLEVLRGTPVAVTLTAPLSSLALFSGISPGDRGVKELLLSCTAPEDINHVPTGLVSGCSFAVERSNWRMLPVLVSLCRRQGMRRLVLPMQRLYGGEVPFFLDRREQDELTAALTAAGGISGLDLTIHDPFLWRAFNPEVPFPQGGCQAANTMIAVAPDGGIYPCPTFPVRLDPAGSSSLKELLLSRAKKELRRRIVEFPEECGDCAELPVCRGGCRGRSYVAYGSLRGIDDACRYPAGEKEGPL